VKAGAGGATRPPASASGGRQSVSVFRHIASQCSKTRHPLPVLWHDEQTSIDYIPSVEDCSACRARTLRLLLLLDEDADEETLVAAVQQANEPPPLSVWTLVVPLISILMVSTSLPASACASVGRHISNASISVKTCLIFPLFAVFNFT